MSKKRNMLLSSMALSCCYFPVVKAQPTNETMVVTAEMIELEKSPGSKTEITQQDMQKYGGNDFGSIMRYQPLISASGSAAGSSSGKSSWDRGGYTGYNIRGLDANRVAIEIDGIAQPIAQGRINGVGRAGFGSYGIGRDYLDPYMYDNVTIEAGATSASNTNNALGGSVAFQPKSASNYLTPNKPQVFNYQSNYDTANHSWHNGLTSSFGDNQFNSILVFSRRDGQETRNKSSRIHSYPENWHSNALLTGFNWQATEEHSLRATLDYYERYKHSNYNTWNTNGTAIDSHDHQNSDTTRLSLIFKDIWTPQDISWIDLVSSQIYYQSTEAKDKTEINNDQNLMKNAYKTKSSGFESKLYKTFNNHSISTGINGKWLEEKSPFWTNRPSTNPILFPNGSYSKPQADSVTYSLGAFAEDRITLTEINHNNLYLVPAVRAIYQHVEPKNLNNMMLPNMGMEELGVEYTNSHDAKVLPSLALMYDLNPQLMMYLEYKRGAQMPNSNQLYGSYLAHYNYYALVGNPKLKTETSNNFEFGLKGEPTKGIILSSSIFYNQYKDFIAYNRYIKDYAGSKNKLIYQASNRDKAYIYGAELNSKFDFSVWVPSLSGLTGRFAIGYNQGKSKSSYLGDKYVEIDSVAPLKTVIGLNWDEANGQYGAALTTTLQKGKRAEPTNRSSFNNNGQPITDSDKKYFRIAGHGIIDLTAYYKVTQNIKLSGGIYNLTNKKYWDYLSNNKLFAESNPTYLDLTTEPGRSLQFGVNIDF